MRIRDGFSICATPNGYIVVFNNDNMNGVQGYLRMNESGKIIWDCICEGLDESQIVSILLDEYEIEVNRAENNVRGMIDKLIANGIIEE